MSHVDDGTLHAYLDGELTPVEIERLETHFAGCSACRARLDEERALIERAARLLDLAVPTGPERAAPPLHQLRHPRPMLSRIRVPLAWAATIVLALGLGYYAAVSSFPMRAEEPAASAEVAVAPQAVTPAPARADLPATTTLSNTGDVEHQRPATLAGGAGAPADRAREESDERQAPARPAAAAEAAGQLARDQAQPGLRAAAPPSPVASNVSPGVSNGMVAPSAQAGFVMRRSLSTTWPVIEAKPARDLLGTDPVVIPGYGVRTLRRNPGAPEILVEQEMANGVVVSLFEQPIKQDAPMVIVDGRMIDSVVAKTRANERLARFIGGLRIEISGPLPMDSLSKLLELIKP